METNIIKIENLAEDVSFGDLYEAIEAFFRNCGLTLVGNNKVVFVPDSLKGKSVHAEKKDSYYFHDALEYKFTRKDGCELGLIILPKFMLTQDGSTWSSDFSRKHSFEESISWNYSQFSDAFSRWLDFFDKKITLNLKNGGSVVINLEADRINDVVTSSINEPKVSFHQSTDESDMWPYMGLKVYHPLDYNLGTRKMAGNTLRLALIGTGMSIPLIDNLKNGVASARFPRFEDVFKSELKLEEDGIIKLSSDKYNNCQTVDDLTALYLQAAQKLKESNFQYDVLIVELPEETSRFFTGQEIDLHDFIKVAFMKEGIPTQIIASRALTSTDSYKYADLALGIYVCAGGKPWKLERQPVDTCFIGISFGVREVSSQTEILVGIAEVFDNFGESISIRGISQTYNKSKGYHLSAENLDTLVKTLLSDYKESRGGGDQELQLFGADTTNLPTKIVIHKTSYFDDEEMGIIERLKDLSAEFELIHITTPLIRLLPGPRTMPNRGLYWLINDEKAVLYTDGMVPHLGRYLGMGSPKPFLITKQSGSDSIGTILEQVMMLTKLNWNSTKNHERTPVTISHARKIVDMLRAGLEPQSIVKDFRYYL